jgi:hypothetical protein
LNCLGATTEYTTLFFYSSTIVSEKKLEITSYPVLLHSMKALKPVKFITNFILQPYITGKCLTNKFIKECFSNHSIAIFHVLLEQTFNTVHIFYKKECYSNLMATVQE